MSRWVKIVMIQLQFHLLVIPSLLKLCKGTIISQELPFRGLVSYDYEKMLEEHNSETPDRLFRVFVLAEEERSK